MRRPHLDMQIFKERRTQIAAKLAPGSAMIVCAHPGVSA